jgi:hypothetical protein
MAVEMRWCPQCRQPLQPGYIFCPGCGSQLDGSPSGMVQPTHADHLGREVQEPRPRSRKGLRVFLCIVAGILAIFFIQSAFGPATKATGNTEVSSPGAATAQPTSESSGADVGTSSDSPAIRHIGDTVSVGYWSYCVNGYKWTSYIPNIGEIQRANADYLVLDMTVRNDDKSASTLPSVKLVNDAGEEFSESPIMEQGFLDILTTLNPHVVTGGLVAFDAPQGHYRAELSGGLTSSDSAFVDLVDLGSSSRSTPPQAQPTSSTTPQTSPATDATPPQAQPASSTAPQTSPATDTVPQTTPPTDTAPQSPKS